MSRLVRSRRSARRGMTLLEVVVAMSILGGALLSMAALMARLAHATGTARLQTIANQLAADRLEVVKSAPRYTAIESLYVRTELSIPGYPGYTRRTMVRRIGGQPTDSIDYKTVTVEIANAQLGRPVRRTTVISFF